MFENERKIQIRKDMLRSRAALPAADKARLDMVLSSGIMHVIKRLDAQVIHTYLPFGDEPDIYPLIQILLDEKYRVVCSRPLAKRKMVNLELRSLSELKEGRFGTKHPAHDVVYSAAIDLFIVPGLAFDKQGHRIGFGSGYYDAFFAEQLVGYKLGICYPFQLIENFPLEAHDVPMDSVIYGQPHL
jgi:5-formyltetrahydrofolate cyclo-ligase